MGNLLKASTQIILNFEIPLLIYTVLLLFAFLFTPQFVNARICSGKISKRRAEKLIISLDWWGAFILATALGGVAGASYGILPAVASIYNPMFGLFPLYVSYLLKLAIQDGLFKAKKSK